MKRISKILLLLLPALLIGCKSTSGRVTEVLRIEAPKPTRNDFDAKLLAQISKLKTDPSSVSYTEMLSTYMESNHVLRTAIAYEEYKTVKQQIDAGILSCIDVDWDEVINRDFWSLPPHISAMTCFEKNGYLEQAQIEENAITFLINGIVASGNGEDFHSAYQVISFGDAEDLIEFLGYEIVTNYDYFKNASSGITSIYIVNDPESGKQKKLYFENNRALHQIMDIQYPYAMINHDLYDQLLTQEGYSQSSMKVSKARLLELDEDFNEAINWLVKASNQGNAWALYKIGMLCLTSTQDTIQKENCVDYLLEAAELDVTDSIIALAYLYKHGITVEQNIQLSEELISAVESRLEPGEVYAELAVLAIDLESSIDLHNEYLQLAAEKGSRSALFDVTHEQLKQEPTNPSLIATLKSLAEDGYTRAQTRYADYLLETFEKGSEEYNSAKTWMKKAAEQFDPQGYDMLGNSYYFNHFGEKDDLKAYLNYLEGALRGLPSSQLQIGYFNDSGIAVEENNEIAALWYVMCTYQFNSICLHNLGIFHLHGVIAPKDLESAQQSFYVSSTLGFGKASYELALMHLDGLGTNKDAEYANIYLNKACEQGYQDACVYYPILSQLIESHSNSLEELTSADIKCNKEHAHNCTLIARAYRDGNNIKVDNDKAASHFFEACRFGEAASCIELSELPSGKFTVTGTRVKREDVKVEKVIYRNPDAEKP